jgi:heat shock protein HslJ
MQRLSVSRTISSGGGATRMAALALLLPLVAAAITCRQPPNAGLGPAAFRAATAGADWELRELAGQPAPTGAGGRSATLRFDPDTARVTGFAGCNRYFGTYTLDGSTIRFGPIGMTKMACIDGMALEGQLASALEGTRSYELGANQLTLVGSNGPVARFQPRVP